MKKLYRSTLVAVVLAFGVVACGDDVQIVEPEPTPPPALSVTLTPQNVNLVVGDNVNLTVGITGGAPGAQTTITCESSNTNVVTATVSGTNCAIAAVGAGNATVTATVQRGNQESSAGAAVSVQAVDDIQQATVTIAEILKGGTTVDINNVFGQLDVRMNVDFGDEQPVRLNLYVDDDIVASQEFSQGVAALEEDDPEAQSQQITLSFNTDYYEIEDGVANIRTLNGDRVISAELVVATADAEPRASNTVTVRFNNADGFHAMGVRPDNSALDPEGRRWYGGPGTSTEVTVIPVFFSGMTVQPEVGVSVTFCGTTLNVDEVPYEFEYSCSNFESARLNGEAPLGEVPLISAQYSEDGNDAPGTILNDDHPFPVRIDNRAPQALTDEEGATLSVFRIARQSGLLNVRNWINNQYAFSSGFSSGNVADSGVRRPANNAGVNYAVSTDSDGDDIIYGPDGGHGLVAGNIGLDETVTNTALVAWVQVCDRLDNCRLFRQEANDPDHPLRTFGYDETAPTLALRTDEMGEFEENYAIVNAFDGNDRISIRGEDVASGFAPIGEGLAFSRALVAVGSQFDVPESPTRVSVVGGTAVSAPFGTVADGGLVAPLHTIAQTGLQGDEDFELITQTAIDYTWSLGNYIEAGPGDPAIDEARYWIYQVRIRDQAGNVTTAYRAVLHNRGASPEIESITRTPGFPADPAFTAVYTADELELFEASIALAYPRTEMVMEGPGYLVWERPGADISSALRMEAAIEDGVPFTDFIKRPHRNLGLPLSFDAHGLPFVKNVQTLTSGTAGTKPTGAQAQVYNGWPIEADDIIHGSPSAIGQSDMVGVGIPAEEIPDATVNYSNTDIVDWRIDDSSAADCDAYCARLMGPSGTFSLPVLRDGVLIVWTDENSPGYWRVLQFGEPNFSGDFPTRDDGEERMYEWTFDGNVEGFDGDVLFGAIAVNSSGDGLLTTQVPADPEFNIRFAQTTQNLENEATNSVTFEVVHGPNSTNDAFTTNSCQWIDENGNVLTTAPAGLTLAQVGNDCEVSTDGTAEIGEEHLVRANVERDATGETDTAMGTVVVIAPEFTLELDPTTATVEVPATGTATQLFTLSDGTDPYTATDVSAYSCSLSPSTTGVSVTEGTDGANLVCEVTVTSEASSGSVNVNVSATEAGTGQTGSAQALLTLEGVEFTVTPDPAEIDWREGVEIALDVGGTRSNADIDHAFSTCAIDSGDMTATYSNDGDDPFCLIEVDDPTAVEEGDEFEVTWTIEFTDGRVDVVTSDAFLGERPEFAPQLDFSLGGDSPDNRRNIERNRTAFFEVLDGHGIGIDLNASEATVSPSGGLVTADVVADGDDILLEVDVPLAADTGNYTITVTFVEDDTGDEVEVLVYITVTDTGQISVDGGL